MEPVITSKHPHGETRWPAIKAELAEKFPGMHTEFTCSPIDWRARCLAAEAALREATNLDARDAEVIKANRARKAAEVERDEAVRKVAVWEAIFDRSSADKLTAAESRLAEMVAAVRAEAVRCAGRFSFSVADLNLDVRLDAIADQFDPSKETE